MCCGLQGVNVTDYLSMCVLETSAETHLDGKNMIRNILLFWLGSKCEFFS